MRAFGVASDWNGMRDVAERSAFLVDAGGTVRGSWHYVSNEVPDFDVLLEAARRL